MTTPTSSDRRLAALRIFSTAAAVLLLELLQTRLYSVIFWNHFVYFIVSLALLGFGISQTWLAIGRHTRLCRWLSIRRAAVFFCVSLFLSILVGPQLCIYINSRVLQLLATYSFAVIPYFFAGWILGTLFRDNRERVHALYFADLAGAATGCFAYVLLIRPLGFFPLLLAVCFLVALPCLMDGVRDKWSIVRGALVVLLSSPVLIYSADINEAIRSDPQKGINRIYTKLAPGDRKVHEYSRWNTISRIDVISTKKQPNNKIIFIDGDAWTGIVNSPDTPPPFVPSSEPMDQNKVPYLIKRDMDSVLVIGAGGGIDVWNALRGGARRVDAVEINPTTYDIGLNVYRTANKGLFHRSGVTLHNEEGRSFVRRSGRKFDVIMIHAIDTFAAINSGSYVLSENYLYTTEALIDYIDHLKDDGILCITRWGSLQESFRLFVMALESLYAVGWKDPEKHITAQMSKWMTMLVSKTPFSNRQLTKLRVQAKRNGSTFLHPRDQASPVADTYDDVYSSYIQARRVGKQHAYLEKSPYDLTPVSDDSPFFFHFEKWNKLIPALIKGDMGNLIRGNWPTLILWALLVFSLLMVTVFILLPLYSHSRRLKRAAPDNASAQKPSSRIWLIFFSFLGCSFIFVEIALMQRFTLLLGHPSRSLALVLGTLLFSTGVGSWSAKRFKIPARVFFVATVTLVLVAAYLYPYVIDICLPFGGVARSCLTIGLIFPLGLFMGMPFPTGLKQVSAENENAVPWMFGINSGTTVVGSIVAIILAMGTGFTVVIALGAAGYLVAFLAYLRAEKATLVD
jgi:spermidine synthase